RFIQTPDGEDGLNYLCAGYKSFFTHVDPEMKLMAGLLKQNRYADEVMGILARSGDSAQEEQGMGDQPADKSKKSSRSRRRK
ncbi:MAG: hypothetical protein JJE12_15880, partial [Anaerolineales bacterium]|nr:hypothetical protein [Anaerolineales bacterium]